MERYIKERYPKAIFDYYFETAHHGTELQFWADENAEDVFSCLLKDGKMEIFEEF